MTDERAPLVLHVLPVDLARGAQTYARELRNALDGPEVRHRTLTLFDSDGGALRADMSLGVSDGPLRRAGVDPRVVSRLRRLVRREDPAIVLAHGSEPLKYAVLAGVPKARLVGLKIGAGHARLGGARGGIYRTLLLRAGAVAAVSETAAAEARDHGVANGALRVIPNGRDPAAFRVRTHTTAISGVRLVWVGHLDDAKRPLRFLELVAALRAAGVDARGAVAGDGPLLPRVRATAGDGVEVLGRVDDVPSLLAESDALVLTSGPNEGMPGVLIEAGMAGLPVVTTDVPGATDVVVDGETGFIVPVDDVRALLDATRMLVEDGSRRARFGAAARARCVEHFSLDANLRAWNALFADLGVSAR
jgi:glycosyltransferase involved in cell wall biosynthesis